MPKTNDFIKFSVQEVPLWEGEGGGGVSHHWFGQKLGPMAESVTGIAVKMAEKLQSTGHSSYELINLSDYMTPPLCLPAVLLAY